VIAQTPFTTDQAAAALGCCRNNTTRKVTRFDKRMTLMVEAMRALAPDERPDRLAEMIVNLLVTGGKLAAADRNAMRRYARRLVERHTSPSPSAPR